MNCTSTTSTNTSFYLRQGGYVFTLFLCLLAGLCKNYRLFGKFDGKVAYGPRKETLDFCDNPDQVMLGLDGGTAVLHMCSPISNGDYLGHSKNYMFICNSPMQVVTIKT